METGTTLTLNRPRGGRRYELRRGDEIAGVVNRRGILRPQYLAELGAHRWEFTKVGSPKMAGVDQASEAEVVRLERIEDKGTRIEVLDEALRPDRDLFIVTLVSGERFIEEDGGDRIQTLFHLGGRQNEIARIDQAAPWPSPDPAGGASLGLALLVVKLVADRDSASAAAFDAS